MLFTHNESLSRTYAYSRPTPMVYPHSITRYLSKYLVFISNSSLNKALAPGQYIDSSQLCRYINTIKSA